LTSTKPRGVRVAMVAFARALALLAAASSSSRAAEPAAEPAACALTPYERATYPVVEALLRQHLLPKHAGQVLNLLADPCDNIKQGLVMNTFKMRNTNVALGSFMRDALSALEPERVGELLSLVPADPRAWILKSFIASLPCRVPRGASRCVQEATNDALEAYETARQAYARRALRARGMEPFPEDDDNVLAGDGAGGEPAMARYAWKLGIEGDAAAWLLEEFEPKKKADGAVLSEPEWFRDVATSCRARAHARAPGAQTADEDGELTNLDNAVLTATWTWHYKTCHKAAVVAAFENRDDPAAAAAAAAASAEL